MSLHFMKKPKYIWVLVGILDFLKENVILYIVNSNIKFSLFRKILLRIRQNLEIRQNFEFCKIKLKNQGFFLNNDYDSKSVAFLLSKD